MGAQATTTAEIDSVLQVIESARRTAEEALRRLRDQNAEKFTLEALSYTHEELSVAEKRLRQRTIHLGASRSPEVVAKIEPGGVSG